MDQDKSPVSPASAETPVSHASEKGSLVARLRKNPRLLVAGIIVAIVLVAGIIYTVASQPKVAVNPVVTDRPWNQSPKFVADKKEGSVGKDTIYGDDLNYKFYTNYQALKNAPDSQVAAVKSDLMSLVASESAMLQAAKDQNIANVPDSLINNPQKDQAARESLVKEISQTIKKDSRSMTYSVVSIWFYNMFAPKVGLPAAVKTAEVKINKLHDQLASGQMTMKQAGDAIKADTDLARLDINYQGNAYQLLENVPPGIGPSRFDQVNEVTLKLKEGEISPVIKVVKTGKELKAMPDIKFTNSGNMDVNEQFFTITKLESVVNGKYPGLRDWVLEAMAKYGYTPGSSQ